MLNTTALYETHTGYTTSVFVPDDVMIRYLCKPLHYSKNNISQNVYKYVRKDEPLPSIVHDTWKSAQAPIRLTPITVTACKISGLKSAHILASKQDIWWSCSQSTFNAVHFVQNPPTCSRKGGKKSRNGFKFGTLLVVFRVTARQAWQ